MNIRTVKLYQTYPLFCHGHKAQRWNYRVSPFLPSFLPLSLPPFLPSQKPWSSVYRVSSTFEVRAGSESILVPFTHYGFVLQLFKTFLKYIHSFHLVLNLNYMKHFTSFWKIKLTCYCLYIWNHNLIGINITGCRKSKIQPYYTTEWVSFWRSIAKLKISVGFAFCSLLWLLS